MTKDEAEKAADEQNDPTGTATDSTAVPEEKEEDAADDDAAAGKAEPTDVPADDKGEDAAAGKAEPTDVPADDKGEDASAGKAEPTDVPADDKGEDAAATSNNKTQDASPADAQNTSDDPTKVDVATTDAADGSADVAATAAASSADASNDQVFAFARRPFIIIILKTSIPTNWAMHHRVKLRLATMERTQAQPRQPRQRNLKDCVNRCCPYAKCRVCDSA